MHEASILSNTTLWYAVSFVVFFIVMFKWARKPILGAIDGEIAKVREELDKARQLRAQAEAALVDGRAKQKAAAEEAEEVLSHAKKEAATLRAQAEEDLKASLARQEQQAMVRIKQAETEAIQEVRKLIVGSAIESARKMLGEGMDTSTSNSIIDRSIDEISKLGSKMAGR